MSVVWREFRVQVIPFVAFAVVIAGAFFVWRTLPFAGSMRGIGEGARSLITSPRVGIVQRVEVQPFQLVKAGDPLMTILPYDPASHVDLLQSEVGLARLRMEPSAAERNALNYEQAWADLVRLQSLLARNKVLLEYGERAVTRNEALLKEKGVSKDDYDISVRDRDAAQAEVTLLAKAITDMEARLNQLRGLADVQNPTAEEKATQQLIANLESQLGTVGSNWNAVVLRAPIDGRVHLIARQENEYVVEGEPLVLIASPRSERIVAYIRQPFSFEPQPGMEMEVSMQSRAGQRFATQITAVGAQLEAITNGLAVLQQGALVDMGLPIVLSVPANIELRPGEVVSIVRRSSRAGALSQTQANAERSRKPVPSPQ